MKSVIVAATVLLLVAGRCSGAVGGFAVAPVWSTLSLAPHGAISSESQRQWSASVQRAMPSLQQVLDTVQSVNNSGRAVSFQCRGDIGLYSLALASAEVWAVTMFDASTKIPESILSGATTGLGNFDQCLGVSAQVTPSHKLYAQFSLPSLRVTEPLTGFVFSYMFAACMPRSCSPVDLQEVLQSMLAPPLAGLGTVEISVTKDNCYTGVDKPSLDAGFFAGIAVFSVLAALLAAATVYHLLVGDDSLAKRGGGGRRRSVILSFSLLRNVSALGSTRAAPGAVSCLHGLRVFSLCWVMLAHRYGSNAFSPSINVVRLLTWLSQPSYQIIINALIAVDTFFFLSGFLVCYVFLNDVSKGRPFNVLKFYLYRYLRLTTAMLAVIVYYATLMVHTGYSPTWRMVVPFHVTTCQQNWWLSLLYLNNYIYVDNNVYTCPEQGWYLSCDMQMSWLAPLLLVPLWKWPRWTTRVILPLTILVSCFIPFAITYVNEFPMAMDFLSTDGDKATRYIIELYQAGHARATPYLAGMALGYAMFKSRHLEVSLPKWVVALGWVCSTGACLAAVLGTAVMYGPDYKYEPVGAAFYAGFHRLAWAAGIAWIIFACANGYGGLVNALLSWRALLPFSRLSYCAFLTHFVILYYDSGHTFALAYLSHFAIVQRFLSDLVMNCWLAVILHLAVEAPTLNLLRIAFDRGPVRGTDNRKVAEMISSDGKSKDETK